MWKNEGIDGKARNGSVLLMFCSIVRRDGLRLHIGIHTFVCCEEEEEEEGSQWAKKEAMCYTRIELKKAGSRHILVLTVPRRFQKTLKTAYDGALERSDVKKERNKQGGDRISGVEAQNGAGKVQTVESLRIPVDEERKEPVSVFKEQAPPLSHMRGHQKSMATRSVHARCLANHHTLPTFVSECDVNPWSANTVKRCSAKWAKRWSLTSFAYSAWQVIS